MSLYRVSVFFEDEGKVIDSKTLLILAVHPVFAVADAFVRLSVKPDVWCFEKARCSIVQSDVKVYLSKKYPF